MLSQSLLALVALPSLAFAHFALVFPSPRGTDDDGEKTFPCAGYAQTQNRTSISTTSFSLALDLGHDRSLISVFLALGNDVGSNFHYLLQPTVQEEGPGDFCFPSVPIPSNLNITGGQNGTIQVVTNGEGGGGLYMCADVTFVTQNAATAPSCVNGTNLRATTASAGVYANGTTSTSTSSTSPTRTGAAASLRTGVWGAVGVAAIGAAALL